MKQARCEYPATSTCADVHVWLRTGCMYRVCRGDCCRVASSLVGNMSLRELEKWKFAGRPVPTVPLFAFVASTGLIAVRHLAAPPGCTASPHERCAFRLPAAPPHWKR